MHMCKNADEKNKIDGDALRGIFGFVSVKYVYLIKTLQQGFTVCNKMVTHTFILYTLNETEW